MNNQGILQKMEQVLRDNPRKYTATTLTQVVYGDRANGHYNFVTKKLREQELLGTLTRDTDGLITILSRAALWPEKVKRLSKTNPTNTKFAINESLFKLPSALRSVEEIQKLLNSSQLLSDILATLKPHPDFIMDSMGEILYAEGEDGPATTKHILQLLLELICYVQMFMGTPDNPCRFFEPYSTTKGEVLEPYQIVQRVQALVRMVN